MTLLLPPEIQTHPEVTFFCPHCGQEHIALIANLYETFHARRAEWTTATRPPDIYRDMAEYPMRESCLACGKEVRVRLHVVTQFTVSAAAPDPLEKYPPNSRYWEAQKRGLPTSPNLKFTTEGSAQP